MEFNHCLEFKFTTRLKREFKFCLEISIQILLIIQIHNQAEREFIFYLKFKVINRPRHNLCHQNSAFCSFPSYIIHIFITHGNPVNISTQQTSEDFFPPKKCRQTQILSRSVENLQTTGLQLHWLTLHSNSRQFPSESCTLLRSPSTYTLPLNRHTAKAEKT